MSAARPGRTFAAVVREVVPWILLVGVLGFLFSTIPLQAVLHAFDRVAVGVYIAAMTSIVVISLLTDALGYLFALRRMVPEHRTSLQNAMELRAASYVPSNLSYALGQGTLVFLLRRKLNVPIDQGISVVLLVTAMNVLVLCLLVGVGVLAGALPSDPSYRLVVYLVLVGAGVYLLVASLKPRYL